MIEQRGLFNHLLSKISDLELSASDVVAQTSPQSFVISVWQFLAPLMVGARVHICADEEARDPALLMQAISREGITILEIVPSLLREILQPCPSESAFRALSRLRSLISTGESLAPDLCRRWFQHFPGVPLINAYGATECSDDVATNRLTSPPNSIAAVPIGRPIANTQPLCPGSLPAAGANRYRWGAVCRRNRRRSRLPQRSGTDAPQFPSRSVLEEPRGASVPDRRFSPLALRWHVGVLRPHRPSGEDPWL